MTKMLRVLRILEMAWLAIAVFSLVMGAYRYNTYGWSAAKWFFAGAMIAGIFFALRRRQRLKFGREESKGSNSDSTP